MRRLLGIVALLAGAPATLPAQSNADPSTYTGQVQPLFQAKCYGCHAGKQQMGGLRLDAKTLAFRGGQSGVAGLVPGKPDASTVYQRIAGLNEQPRMPMGGKPLSAAELTVVKKWIEGGAVWPESGDDAKAEIKKHWAYVPPVRPALPAVQDAKWARTPIDRFILARLEKESLRPSADAERTTLLRRLSLDLTGLPPTIEEVDAFLRDKSATAYEKQVDRLLASPHYGERWGRHWLDAARYADSDGFEKDKQRSVWFYRDWVIQALNRDLPYDQFVIQQLAGDLLPNATQDQRVATGFLRNSMINEEGGIDPEQFRMEAMFDRMDAVGKAVLGVTIQCAQCHNHKFDPLTQEEYYRLFAFLNDSHEGSITVYTPEEEQRRGAIYRRTRAAEADLQKRAPDWSKRMAAWEAAAKRNQPEWSVIRPAVDDISTGGQKYLPMKDGSLLAAGYAPTKHRVKLTVKTELQNITGVRLDLLMDPNLPMGGPGRSPQGTAALTEFEVEAAPANDPEKLQKICISRASADVNVAERPLHAMYHDKSEAQKQGKRVTGPIRYAIDADDTTAWGIDAGPGLRNQPRKAVFVFDQPVSFAKGAILNIYLKQNHGGWNSDDNQNHNLGRFRLSLTSAADPVADPLPARVREIIESVPAEKRTPDQVAEVFSYWRTTVPEWKAVNEQIATAWAGYPEGSSQLVLQARAESRETHMLERGDFLKPRRTVGAGTPAFLNPLPAGAPINRLTFATWLVDRQAPTTARALVNRVWQAYFGTGLVETSEDLGRQSPPPSHPELLDWLAVDFMDNGWSVKKLHRSIVTSGVYRQSSAVTPELLSKDPANRLLARGPRFRVEGEIVRDLALAASGLLNDKVGGPSVYPPAPDFLFKPPTSYGPKIWEEAQGPDRYRRALYTFRYRSVPYPALQNFDTPNGDFSCVRRGRSNTPLQALTTLNEPLFFEAAQALGRLALKSGATDLERLSYTFRRVLARPPDQTETKEMMAFLERQAQRAPEERWTAVARVVLNLDEAVTKE